MNEPSNFLDGQADGCPKSKSGNDGALNDPPYVPRDVQGGKLYYHVRTLEAIGISDYKFPLL